MDDLEYIKNFGKINIKKACQKVKVDRSNLYNGKVKPEQIKKVKRQLENDLARLYLIDNEENKGE